MTDGSILGSLVLLFYMNSMAQTVNCGRDQCEDGFLSCPST